MNQPAEHSWPDDVTTLAIDIGGSGVKGSVLDAEGSMITERVRYETPYPCPPEVLLGVIERLKDDLPEADRVSVGFPGLVRDGVVVYVTAFARDSYDGDRDPALVQAWDRFDLAGAIEQMFGKPAKVANDADMQACAVVQGQGFEFVVTLGTGVGTALFNNGRLLPHLELGHAPFRKADTFEEQLGNVVRKEIGRRRWTKRVLKALPAYRRFLFFDKVYIGGGNAKKLPLDELPDYAEVVPNSAGITGGVKVWDYL